MSTTTADWVGLTLDQRYRVVALLGEGGMGYVLRARDNRLGCDVVLKVPRPEMLADAEFRKRFRDEVAALVRLAHPHIVRVTDYGQHEGTPFAVMPFLPGGSLDDRRPRTPDKRPKPIAAKSLAEWLAPVGDALDFIHSQGYIHRDIKPANILFDAHKHPFISDFGVAKAMAGGTTDRKGLTGIGMVLGTPEYLAPEVILGQPFDGRIDQYALAITIYELLTGDVPFTGPTGPAVLVKQTTETARPLHELKSTVSAALSAAVARAMAKNPAERFASCKEFAAAVLSGLSGPAVKPTPASTPAPIAARASAETPRATATKPMAAQPIAMDFTGGKAAPIVPPNKRFSPPMVAAGISGAILAIVVGGYFIARPSHHTAASGSEVARHEPPPDNLPKDEISIEKDKSAPVDHPVPKDRAKGPTGKRNPQSRRGAKNKAATPPVETPPSAPTSIDAIRITPTSLKLVAGGPKQELIVGIDRTGIGPLTVEMDGGNIEINPRQVVLRAQDRAARFQVAAASSAQAQTALLTVRITGADTPRAESVPFTVIRVDFAIALADPSALMLEPGDMRDIRLSVDRSGGYQGPIVLATEPSQFVSVSPAVTIPGGASSATVRLQVKPNAPTTNASAHLRATATDVGLVRTVNIPLKIFKPLTLLALVGTKKGQPVAAVALHGSFNGVLKVLSADIDGNVHSWYRREPRRHPTEFQWDWTQTEHRRAITSLTYSLDGRQALSGSVDGIVCLWETHTRNELVAKLNQKGEWHKSGVWQVFFQPQGPLPSAFGMPGVSLSSPAPGSLSDDACVVWDAAAGAGEPMLVQFEGRRKQALYRAPPGGTLKTATTLIPQAQAEGYYLAGMAGNTLQVYQQDRLIASLTGNGGAITAMSLSANGRRALTLGSDDQVRLWDVTSKMLVPGFPWKSTTGVSAATISPDGTLMLVGSPDGSLRLWKLP